MKNVFSAGFQMLFAVSYTITGFIGFFAIIKGFQVWFNIPWILALIVSAFLTYIPLLGNFVMYHGMVNGWGWNKLLSFFIAFFPVVLVVIYLIGVLTVITFDMIKTKHRT